MKTIDDAKQAVATSERLASAMRALTKVNKAVSCKVTLNIRTGSGWGDSEDYKIEGVNAFGVVIKLEIARLTGIIADCVRTLRQLDVTPPRDAVDLMEGMK